MGFQLLKNVGENIIDAIVKSRENGRFLNLNDFIERIYKVDKTSINKRAVESLIKAGALNSLGGNRAQYLAIFEKTIDGISNDIKKNIDGQFSLFEAAKNKFLKKNFRNYQSFPLIYYFKWKRKCWVSMYQGILCSHMKEKSNCSQNFHTTDIIAEQFDTEIKNDNIEDGKQVYIVGLITDKKIKSLKITI
jgi:DNA polymerase III, alpha subunit